MKKNWSLVLIASLIIIISALIIYIVKINNTEKNKENDYVAQKKETNITKVETKDEITYEVIDYNKKLSYSWTFKKDEKLLNKLKDNMEIDLNLKLDLLNNLENNNLTSKINNDRLIISFSHHGELPTKAKIKIDVKDKYNEGDLLYLYYLNEEKHQIEFIKDRKSVV